MYRAIPEVNRPVYQREIRQARRIHLKHLQDLRPNNLTTLEEGQQTGLSHKKRQMLSENKYTEIERENRILLSKISDIMLQKNVSPKHREQQLSPTTRMSSKSEYKHSLNLQYRRREFQRIEVENAKLLRRLQTKKSPYEAYKLQKDWEQKKQVIRNMSSFPVILFDKVADDKPSTTKTYKGYTSSEQLNNTADFRKGESERSELQSIQPGRRKSNREIKLSRNLKIDGRGFIVTVKLTSEKLLIQAVLNRKRDELKVIEINREQALDFIYHECKNTIDNIFQKLRYDGQTLFLVAGQTTDSINGVAEKKVQRQKPLLKIESDVNISIEPDLVCLSADKRVVASSLQRIEESQEPQLPHTNSDWNKATI